MGYTPTNPIGYLLLADVYRDLYNVRESCDDLKAARANYTKVLSLNDQIDEARSARAYLQRIDAILPQLKCS